MRLAMLGRSEGNGHPYSWSAIINGYDSDKMRALCPFPNICDYLGRQSRNDFGIGRARVSHIWAEDKAEAGRIARCSNIEHVVSEAVDVIREVDAVIIAQDEGEKHLAMAKPFLEQGVPVFIDKPLCINLDDLKVFCEFNRAGSLLMSCSSARYAQEYIKIAKCFPDKDGIQAIHSLAIKSWEKYGIHALEAIVPIIGSEFCTVRYLGSDERPAVLINTPEGILVWLQLFPRAIPAMSLRIIGEQDSQIASWEDYFSSFKTTLSEFISSVAEGKARIDFAETVNLIKVIIAGVISREQKGKEICLSDLKI